ncbi:MAG: DsbA family protein [Pseudomonadota bacterium]
MTRLFAACAAFAVGALLVVGAAPAQAQSADAPEIIDMTMGNPDAPVTVIEYASYTCPHCKSFHEGTFKDLKEDYIDTGKVHFVYREVYFDRPGLWAAMVARCGGPERYFGISDLLYAGQSEWAGSGDPAQIAEALRRIGRTAGLSDDELDACLSDADKAQAMVAAYQANTEEHGISATPSFVINGETYRNMSYGEMKTILDEAGS